MGPNEIQMGSIWVQMGLRRIQMGLIGFNFGFKMVQMELLWVQMKWLNSGSIRVQKLSSTG